MTRALFVGKGFTRSSRPFQVLLFVGVFYRENGFRRFSFFGADGGFLKKLFGG
jgi:hypothetical protein